MSAEIVIKKIKNNDERVYEILLNLPYLKEKEEEEFRTTYKIEVNLYKKKSFLIRQPNLEIKGIK